MKRILFIKLFTLIVGTSGLISCGTVQIKSSKPVLKSKTAGYLKNFLMESPDHSFNPSIVFDTSDGTLHYSLAGEISDINEATGKLGFITTKDDYSSNFLDTVTITDAQYVHDSFKTCSGKSEEVDYEYNKYTLVADAYSSSSPLTIDCRVYNNGFAFRYRFSSNGETITTDDPLKYTEQTTFNLYKGNNARYIYQQASKGKYEQDYENLYINTNKDESDHSWRAFPFLETQDGKPSVLFAEAGLDGSYCDSGLRRIGNYTLQVTPTYQQLYYDYNSVSRTISMKNFTSPWRAFIVGDYGDIVTSDLIDALNEECVVEDTSWIRPGTCAWSWKGEDFEGQSNESVHKKYIDFASEMGWKYYILDEGWPYLTSNSNAISKGLVDSAHQDTSHMPNHGFMYAIRPNTTRLIQYAKERNVGLIAWIHNSQICDPSNDYAKMDGVLASLSAAGFKGIKADFFEYPTQNLDQQLRKLYELTAKYHLILNVHGSNLPTGERRTFPQVINRESIFGQENERNKDRINPTLILSNAFTRGVIGPTDFTPYVNASEDTHLQLSSQMAIPILLESGTTCIASNTVVFRNGFMNYNKDIQNFYRNLPSSWKKTVYISGSPNLGNNFSLVLARQTKNNDWYVGGMFDDSLKNNYTLDLSFLGEGNYRAEVFKGKAHTSQLSSFAVMDNVTKDTKIDFPICDNGGFVARITSVDNKINIVDSSPLTITAYRDDSTTPITSGEPSQLGHKIRLEITAPSADLLPEYAYVNGEPFYIIPSTEDITKGTVNGINEVFQNINITVTPSRDSRTLDISCSFGGSTIVCDDLRKYYKSGDDVKVATKLTIYFKYDKNLYTVALSINDISIELTDDESYSFEVLDTYSNLFIKVIYTALQ